MRYTPLRFFLAAGLLISCGATAEQSTAPTAPSSVDNKHKPTLQPAETAPLSIQQQAVELAQSILIVDGHIDLPYRLHNLKDEGKPAPDLSLDGAGNFDAFKAKTGGLDAPFMSIYIPAEKQKTGGAKQLADELIDGVYAIVKTWPEQFATAHTPAAVQANFRAGRVSLLLGIENGAALEDDIKNVEHFFRRGVRYITLTHSKDNLICDSSYDSAHKWGGLSPYGEKVVAEMNRVGILVDVSHVSDESFYDVMRVTQKPVIASHSSMRHYTSGFERNMNDDMVRALAKNKGVVMINFGSTFISETSRDWRKRMVKALEKFAKANPKANAKAKEAFSAEWEKANPMPYATVEDVADHIEHVIKLVGIDYVGLGSDFDGVGDSLPIGLKTAADYPNLIAVLLRRGYSHTDISKIASGNLLRVWNAQNGAVEP